MDRFDAMRVFTRIVERRSFTRAADDLGLPRSSVTDAVKGLEARLGVRLLQRSTRHVSPSQPRSAIICFVLNVKSVDANLAAADMADLRRHAI
jgi:hypothetical protein